jgi:N-acetylglucosamine-6-phosphate deacetylase
MIVLSGGDVVLPDRIQKGGSVILSDGKIAAIEAGPVEPAGATIIDASGSLIVPGFIDVHVHGVDGHDTLDGGNVVSQIARALPRFGVTAFCPTTVACGPDALQEFLDEVGRCIGAWGASSAKGALGARVLPAHLESNFINPEYRGAQPIKCLRVPDEHRGAVAWPFTGSQILEIIESSQPSIGIVTLAPELPGCIDLTRALVAAGHIVSLGHSGANFETAIEAIEAGATHATHLFNRMTPIAHRAPGLVGAVLARHEVSAELICDGYHVHPAMCAVAIAAKGPSRVMAISDGTSGSGLTVGSISRLGGQSIHVRDMAAFLDDGTLAGSTLTMDRGFRNLVTTMRQSIVDAAMMCSTTPANQLGLAELGRISEGGQADLTVLDRDFQVVRTFVAGEQVWPVG